MRGGIQKEEMGDNRSVIKAVLTTLLTKSNQTFLVVAHQLHSTSLLSEVFIRQKEDVTRIENYYENVIPRYMPDEFRSHFRLTRESFDYLSMRIANCKTYNKQRGPEADPVRDPLMFLWYIGKLFMCF